MRMRAVVYSLIVAILLVASTITTTTVNAKDATEYFVKEYKGEIVPSIMTVGNSDNGYIAVPIFNINVSVIREEYDVTFVVNVRSGVMLLDTAVGTYKAYVIKNITLVNDTVVRYVTYDSKILYGGIVSGVGVIGVNNSYILVYKTDFDGNVEWALLISSMNDQDPSLKDFLAKPLYLEAIGLPDGKVGIVWLSDRYFNDSSCDYFYTVCILIVDAYNGVIVSARGYEVKSFLSFDIGVPPHAVDIVYDSGYIYVIVMEWGAIELEEIGIPAIAAEVFKFDINGVPVKAQVILAPAPELYVSEDYANAYYYPQYYSIVSQYVNYNWVATYVKVHPFNMTYGYGGACVRGDRILIWTPSVVLYGDLRSNKALWAASISSTMALLFSTYQQPLYALDVHTYASRGVILQYGTILENGSVVLGGIYWKGLAMVTEGKLEEEYPVIVMVDESGRIVYSEGYDDFIRVEDCVLVVDKTNKYSWYPQMAMTFSYLECGDNLTAVVYVPTWYLYKEGVIYPATTSDYPSLIGGGYISLLKLKVGSGRELSPETIKEVLPISDNLEVSPEIEEMELEGSVSVMHDIINGNINGNRITISRANINVESLSEIETSTLYEKAEEIPSEFVLPWWLTALLVAVVVIAVLAIVNVAKHTIEDVRYSRMRFVRRK